jgi:hypothetical protein
MDRDQGFGFFRDVVSTLVKVGDCKVLALVLEWESDAMVSSHDEYAIKHTSANVDEFIQPELAKNWLTRTSLTTQKESVSISFLLQYMDRLTRLY